MLKPTSVVGLGLAAILLLPSAAAHGRPAPITPLQDAGCLVQPPTLMTPQAGLHVVQGYTDNRTHSERAARDVVRRLLAPGGLSPLALEASANELIEAARIVPAQTDLIEALREILMDDDFSRLNDWIMGLGPGPTAGTPRYDCREIQAVAHVARALDCVEPPTRVARAICEELWEALPGALREAECKAATFAPGFLCWGGSAG